MSERKRALILASFRIFTAMSAMPSSHSTFDWVRTDNLWNPKLAFRFPKVDSTSLFNELGGLCLSPS